MKKIVSIALLLTASTIVGMKNEQEKFRGFLGTIFNMGYGRLAECIRLHNGNTPDVLKALESHCALLQQDKIDKYPQNDPSTEDYINDINNPLADRQKKISHEKARLTSVLFLDMELAGTKLIIDLEKIVSMEKQLEEKEQQLDALKRAQEKETTKS